MDSYHGVYVTNTYFTGHKGEIESTLVRSIAAICRMDRSVEKYYIGVAGGYDYWLALTRRIDQKKLENAVTHMYLLYQSSSEYNTRSLETRLIRRFRDVQSDECVWNAVGGGGGRRGGGPLYFLYLAVSRA